MIREKRTIGISMDSIGKELTNAGTIYFKWNGYFGMMKYFIEKASFTRINISNNVTTNKVNQRTVSRSPVL